MTIRRRFRSLAVAAIAIVCFAASGTAARAAFATGDFVTLRQVDWDQTPLLQTPQPFST